MAFTQAEADALRAAIAQGALRVQIEGRLVEYPSFEDLRARLLFVESQIAAAGPAKPPVARRAVFRRS